MVNPLPAEVGREQLIQREQTITRNIHQSVLQCMNTKLPPAERGNGWANALRLVGDKTVVHNEIRRAQRDISVGSEVIHRFDSDNHWLAETSPQLHELVTTNQTYDRAGFAIAQYFVIRGHHNLVPEQVSALAHAFPPRFSAETFDAYKGRVESVASDQIVPGRNTDENWLMRREILDILEITDNLERGQLQGKFGKTIGVKDITHIATNALQLVHQLATVDGLEQIQRNDTELFQETAASPVNEKRNNLEQLLMDAWQDGCAVVIRNNQEPIVHGAWQGNSEDIVSIQQELLALFSHTREGNIPESGFTDRGIYEVALIHPLTRKIMDVRDEESPIVKVGGLQVGKRKTQVTYVKEVVPVEMSQVRYNGSNEPAYVIHYWAGDNHRVRTTHNSETQQNTERGVYSPQMTGFEIAIIVPEHVALGIASLSQENPRNLRRIVAMQFQGDKQTKILASLPDTARDLWKNGNRPPWNAWQQYGTNKLYLQVSNTPDQDGTIDRISSENVKEFSVGPSTEAEYNNPYTSQEYAHDQSENLDGPSIASLNALANMGEAAGITDLQEFLELASIAIDRIKEQKKGKS